MNDATLSTPVGRRQARDFERTLRKLRKCLYIYTADTGRCGLGIFTAKPFKEGEQVLVDLDGDYYDRVVSYDQLKRFGIDLDITFQVGLDAYKLPTGSLEDFTNHSCDPNTGIKLLPSGTIIIALRNIAVHEELTYDYSTYLNNPYEIMNCRCGSNKCRGVIGNFASLPNCLKRRYLDLGIVGDFVTEGVG
jgi:hypothetical protein